MAKLRDVAAELGLIPLTPPGGAQELETAIDLQEGDELVETYHELPPEPGRLCPQCGDGWRGPGWCDGCISLMVEVAERQGERDRVWLAAQRLPTNYSELQRDYDEPILAAVGRYGKDLGLDDAYQTTYLKFIDPAPRVIDNEHLIQAVYSDLLTAYARQLPRREWTLAEVLVLIDVTHDEYLAARRGGAAWLPMSVSLDSGEHLGSLYSHDDVIDLLLSHRFETRGLVKALREPSAWPTRHLPGAVDDLKAYAYVAAKNTLINALAHRKVHHAERVQPDRHAGTRHATAWSETVRDDRAERAEVEVLQQQRVELFKVTLTRFVRKLTTEMVERGMDALLDGVEYQHAFPDIHSSTRCRAFKAARDADAVLRAG